jgi:hypothetical protein
MQRMTEAAEGRALHLRHIIVTWFLRCITAGSKTWVMLMVLLAVLVASPAFSQNLKGIVKGQDGKPKPYVLVDILGPSKVYTQADEAGQFEAKVLPGTYSIRIREGRRRMEFSQRVTDGVNKAQFKLGW